MPHAAGAAALAALLSVTALSLGRDSGARPSRGSTTAGAEEAPEPADLRAGPSCEASPAVLARVRRGYYPQRSGDLFVIEKPRNQFGTRHSTPHAHTQRVPLMLYGPGYIRPGFTSERPATVADLAPTLAELLAFDAFGQRDGRVLEGALLPEAERNGRPKLIVTVVWDGGGVNVLDRWPDAWPQLRGLMRRGASFSKATVGSSPSITAAVHATIGTGFFPATHGVTDGRIRVGERLVDPWEGSDPRRLEAETLADAWDAANENRPVVGMMARDGWHLGMMGHGAALEAADRDIAVLDDLDALRFTTNRSFYALPSYILGNQGLAAAASEIDRRDGAADGAWLGNPLDPTSVGIRETPAWPIFQTHKVTTLLEGAGFGADDVPDLFFVNYKSTDLAGHHWNMVEPEVRDALEEQDRQLDELVDFLDELVGRRNYVLALTADHGMTPHSWVRGGWSIDQEETTADVARSFGVRGLIRANRGYQLFLDETVLEEEAISPRRIAAFLRAYSARQNLTPDRRNLDSYRGSLDDRVFLDVLTRRQLLSEQCASRGDSQ